MGGRHVPKEAALTAITVRPETPADFPAVRELHGLAFPDEDVAGLVEALRETAGYDPRLSLVAGVDGGVVGHVMFTSVTIETPGGEVPAVTLAPLGVTPDWQNRGIGSRLSREGIEACRQLGHRIVTVIGHPTYYPRFGFLRASELGIAMTHGRLDSAKMILALAPGALDGVQGLVRYPSVFDEP